MNLHSYEEQMSVSFQEINICQNTEIALVYNDQSQGMMTMASDLELGNGRHRFEALSHISYATV